MKTPDPITRKLNNVIVGLTVLMCVTLFLTSCQKEEMQQPAAESSVTPINDQNALIKLTNVMVFTSIKIDHIAAMSQLPDYSITVNSNGTGTYEGRRNVHIIGTRSFEIKHSALLEINNICLSTNFFQLKGGINFIPDMPGVETTYTIYRRKLSLSDYEGEPAALVAYRTKIENTLDLSRFTNAPAGTAVAFEVK